MMMEDLWWQFGALIYILISTGCLGYNMHKIDPDYYGVFVPGIVIWLTSVLLWFIVIPAVVAFFVGRYFQQEQGE